MQSINPAELREAKDFMVHDIAPTLNPNVRGLFHVRLSGLHRNHGGLQIYLVNGRREVLKDFGFNVVPVGGAVIIDKHPSALKLVDGETPVTAFFQAWIIGINKEHTEAEISLRLVDENRKELLNFGSVLRKVGGTITLEGMEITVNILPKGIVA